MKNRAGKPGDFLPFEAVDHTADLAYVARGRSLEELFENAARGMFAFLIDAETIRTEREDRIELEAADREESLISWLQELLYRTEVHRMLYREFEIHAAGPPRLVAICRGESYDPSRHEIETEIKAATYHDLHIITETTSGGDILRARIVLDI